MDDKYHFLKKGMKVVDLGAAPGGWTQVLVERCGEGNVLGVDLQPMDPMEGAVLLELNFMDDAAPAIIREKMSGAVNAVVSDMAAPATGHRETDHLRIMGLCEAALEFACDVLSPGGIFLCKVLQGGTEKALLETLKKRFGRVLHMKPPASRSDSAEMYVIALNFR
jgi:23S rRNA (uridine2552-2'-O)-methyltransferase